MSAFEPRWGRTGGLQSARALNNRPMRFGSARRRAASIKADARAGGWVAGQAVGALEQAEAGEEKALGKRAMGCRAGVASGGGECGEIDMGGQVGGAGGGERIGGAAIAHAWRLSPGALCSGP